MNQILGLGKYLFIIPFAVFGIFHFMGAEAMAPMAPFGGEVMVYVTGLAHFAAVAAMLMGKMDKLAAALLGLMLLIFALSIHLSAAMEGDATNFLKDTMLAGAAWMYASRFATDNAVIG